MKEWNLKNLTQLIHFIISAFNSTPHGGPNFVTLLFIFAWNNGMHPQNPITFGTHEVHEEARCQSYFFTALQHNCLLPLINGVQLTATVDMCLQGAHMV